EAEVGGASHYRPDYRDVPCRSQDARRVAAALILMPGLDPALGEPRDDRDDEAERDHGNPGIAEFSAEIGAERSQDEADEDSAARRDPECARQGAGFPACRVDVAIGHEHPLRMPPRQSGYQVRRARPENNTASAALAAIRAGQSRSLAR